MTVDGVDGCGKTTMADELAEVLLVNGRVVGRASVDGFHHPRAVRHARGTGPNTFWRDSFDYVALRRELLDPWRYGSGLMFCAAIHDLNSDAFIPERRKRVPEHGILLVNGIFTQRDELRGYWDLAIFLDVPFEVSVARMAARDGTAASPEDESQIRYVGGQRIYFAECSPRERADVVVDNSDLSKPRIR